MAKVKCQCNELWEDPELECDRSAPKDEMIEVFWKRRGSRSPVMSLVCRECIELVAEKFDVVSEWPTPAQVKRVFDMLSSCERTATMLFALELAYKEMSGEDESPMLELLETASMQGMKLEHEELEWSEKLAR